MDPRTLFPVLAVLFAAAALWRRARGGRWHGAALTWVWMAAVFGAVALWLLLGA
ncbi:MAG: hypothetical protein KGL78_12885 [Burkholderiales bacterium]|nr:hypothetical protein [Burkholderiales bacterium]